MPEPFRVSLSRLVRTTRVALDVTQDELAAAACVSRAYLASIELGRANPTMDVVERLTAALGLQLSLGPGLVIAGSRPTDLVHARCSAYVQRRLTVAGLTCRREVPIVDGRYRGWIDLLAFDPRTRTLLVIEVKTELTDIGRVERQIGWYERSAAAIGRASGWQVQAVAAWLLCLASDEVDQSIRASREPLRLAFPGRAPAMRRGLSGVGTMPGRGLALIDPGRRRRDWLLPSLSDGRRSIAPYRDYADAARRFSAR